MENPIEYLLRLRHLASHSPLGERARDLIMSAGADNRALFLITEACQKLNTENENEAKRIIDDLVAIYLIYREGHRWAKENPGYKDSPGPFSKNSDAIYHEFQIDVGDRFFSNLLKWRHLEWKIDGDEFFSAFESSLNLGNRNWSKEKCQNFLKTYLRRSRPLSMLIRSVPPFRVVSAKGEIPYTESAKLTEALDRIEKVDRPILICELKKGEKIPIGFIYIGPDNKRFTDSDPDIEYSENDQKPYARAFLQQLFKLAVRTEKPQFSLEVEPIEPGHLKKKKSGREIDRYKSRAEARLKKFTGGQLSLDALGCLGSNRHREAGTPTVDFDLNKTKINFVLVEAT